MSDMFNGLSGGDIAEGQGAANGPKGTSRSLHFCRSSLIFGAPPPRLAFDSLDQ
jgi:hypothetical protein